MSSSGDKKKPVGAKPSQEEVVAHFNRLRQTQRQFAAKLSELQMDLNEHKWVQDQDSPCHVQQEGQKIAILFTLYATISTVSIFKELQSLNSVHICKEFTVLVFTCDACLYC